MNKKSMTLDNPNAGRAAKKATGRAARNVNRQSGATNPVGCLSNGETTTVERPARFGRQAAVEMVVEAIIKKALDEAAAPVDPAPTREAAIIQSLVQEALAMAAAPTVAMPADQDAEVAAPIEPVAEPVAATPEAEVDQTVEIEAPVAGPVTPARVIEAPDVAPLAAMAYSGPPAEQPHAAAPHYVRPPLENKYVNKEVLRERLWLRKEFKPIISYVGRLDFQKGVQLIKHGIFYALQNGAQFVLLGVGSEHHINDEFRGLKQQLNDNPDCHLEISFNEELSRLIYAGSDMIIMPSLYEPCGLTQMIALKYGTVPIVRAVGGLVDTVFDRDYSDRPVEQRNGYVFYEPDATGLESAMRRAIGLWYSYPDEFRKLMINGMRCDYSWNKPGQDYLNIYEYIRCK